MTVYRRLVLIVATLVLTGCALLPYVAHAAESRPNALDRRIDAIPSVQFEREPATLLVDGDRQIAAQHLARSMLIGWFASIAFQIVALAYFWQSGAAARLRDRFRATMQSEFFVRFVFGASLVLIARLAALVPAFYLFRVSRLMGIADQLLRGWASSYVVNTVLAMLIAGFVVSAVLWLVDRTHQWYIYTMAAIVAICFALGFVEPFFSSPPFNRSTPLPSAVARALAPLDDRAGLHPRVTLNPSPMASHVGSAQVQGFGPTERIVVDESLIAGATLPEVRFLYARELGGIAAHDITRIAAYNALLFIVGVALAVSIADRFRFRRDDDPVSRLALLGALLGCVYLVIAPIDNAILRSMSRNADSYAIALTGDRVAAVRTIVRTADQRLEEVCPSVGTRWFFQTWAAIGERVAAINNVPNRCP